MAGESGSLIASTAVGSSWDQRATFAPPPYRGAMRRMSNGLSIGDELIDSLPLARISPCKAHRQCSTLMEDIPQLPEPAWVDWAVVRHGQALWLQHVGSATVSLMNALMQGFSIARFAEVLKYSGYSKSPLVSAERYLATGFFWLDWWLHPLDDAKSQARKSIYTVRCMHSFARRQCSHLFSAEEGEGIPLSQYDLAEVQLGFSGVCLSIMEVELGMGKLPEADVEAMVHVWRLIGWHLGILDEFNVCSSVPLLRDCMSDYMVWIPQRFLTCREATHHLQDAVVRGFGQHAILGERYFEGLLVALQDSRHPGISYVRSTPLDGMPAVAKFLLRLCGTRPVNAILRTVLLLARKRLQYMPHFDAWLRRNVSPIIGKILDLAVWPAVSLLMRVLLPLWQIRAVRAARGKRALQAGAEPAAVAA